MISRHVQMSYDGTNCRYKTEPAGTALNVYVWKSLTSLSLNTHKHQQCCMSFLWYEAWVQKETKKSLNSYMSFHSWNHSHFVMKKVTEFNLSSRGKIYLLHFFCLSEICTVCKNCISSDNISTFVSKYRHSWLVCLECELLSFFLLINVTSCQ